MPQEASVEVQSSKRKVIRAESEETQDYVRGDSGHQPGRSRAGRKDSSENALKGFGKLVRRWQWMISGNLQKSTDFLRRIIAPVDGMGGVTLSYVCPHCNCFPLDDHIWWVSTGRGDGNNRKKKHCNWWCAACGGQCEWRALDRILVVQIGVNANEAKVYKAHAAPLGLCDNVIHALKLLANQQKDGDSPIQSIVTGLHERSRRDIMDGLRRFVQADNHSSVGVGDLHQGTSSLQVRKPQFSEAFPEATIREGADELTLRADEVGTQRTFIDTTHIELER